MVVRNCRSKRLTSTREVSRVRYKVQRNVADISNNIQPPLFVVNVSHTREPYPRVHGTFSSYLVGNFYLTEYRAKTAATR